MGKFKIGELITGIKNNGYSTTHENCLCEVINDSTIYGAGFVKVKIVSQINPDGKPVGSHNIGKTATVEISKMQYYGQQRKLPLSWDEIEPGDYVVVKDEVAIWDTYSDLFPNEDMVKLQGHTLKVKAVMEDSKLGKLIRVYDNNHIWYKQLFKTVYRFETQPCLPKNEKIEYDFGFCTVEGHTDLPMIHWAMVKVGDKVLVKKTTKGVKMDYLVDKEFKAVAGKVCTIDWVDIADKSVKIINKDGQCYSYFYSDAFANAIPKEDDLDKYKKTTICEGGDDMLKIFKNPVTGSEYDVVLDLGEMLVCTRALGNDKHRIRIQLKEGVPKYKLEYISNYLLVKGCWGAIGNNDYFSTTVLNDGNLRGAVSDAVQAVTRMYAENY